MRMSGGCERDPIRAGRERKNTLRRRIVSGRTFLRKLVIEAKTRDGVVCILHSGEDADPVPKCPLPEYDDDLLTMPVSQLRNAAMTDPGEACYSRFSL